MKQILSLDKIHPADTDFSTFISFNLCPSLSLQFKFGILYSERITFYEHLK